MSIIEERPYRNEHFTRRDLIRGMSFRGGPEPGDPFPDFELMSLDDEKLTRHDLAGRPVLITLGSRTCAMTAAGNRILKRLHQAFGREIAFVTVYVKEAHPGDKVPQPSTMEEKVANARWLRGRDGISWTVLIDGIEGDLHRQLGEHSNAAFLLDGTGNVAYRVLWSSDERGLREGISAVLEADGSRGQSTRKVAALLSGIGCMADTLDEAGPAARKDALRQTPSMYALSKVARRFSPLPPLGRGAAAAGLMLSAAGLLIGAVARTGKRR